MYGQVHTYGAGTSRAKATIPEHFFEDGEGAALAIDTTASQGWASTQEFAVESKVRAAHADPDDEGYDEYGDVELGDDGRVIRGADKEARAIYQTGTGKRIARVVTGFYHLYSTITRTLRYHGDPYHIEIGDPVANFIVGFDVTTAEDPEAGIAVYDSAADIAGDITQVHADMGFTKYIERFLAHLRERGSDPILRQPVTALKHPKKVYVGKRKREYWYYCGYFFPPWLSEDDLLLPEGADQKTREAHFARLAGMALTRNQALPGGTTQLECPQCSGRVTSDRKTRRKNVEENPNAEHLIAETTVDENGEPLYCCESTTIHITAKQARHFQLPPYGTRAHRIAAGYRNPVEGSNSIVKDKGGLEPGWCRMFGRSAQLFGGLMLVLAHNMGIRSPKPAPEESPAHGPTRETAADTDQEAAADATDRPETARPPP